MRKENIGKFMSVKDLTTYEVLKDEDLKGIKAKGKLLKHKKSGARVLLVENDDNNKVFSIAFRTPPSDSTGVPHIMEHSVLCGSKNFPAKDPFVELVKGSLNTFLNAMTYPDKTVYPVASCNDKDFQNLMHVYMDAVLYPNIYNHDKTFRQEGWSYKLDEKDGELSYNGVVYNEMKGAFSSPEGVLDRVVLNTLFPDNCYANESGGDPEVIPQLTYEQFLDFHRTYYHPSNSYIYLYGDMDMEEKRDIFDRLMHLPVLNIFEPFYKKHKEVLMYLFFGGITFFLNIALYAWLDGMLGINALIANVICWVVCVLFQYFTNRTWVFDGQVDSAAGFLKQMASFFGGRLFTLVVEEAILAVFITWLGFNSMAVKLIAQVVVIVLNYIISKLIVFKK